MSSEKPAYVVDAGDAHSDEKAPRRGSTAIGESTLR